MTTGITNFDASMTVEEMESGELFHREFEDRRRIAMLASLTNSSSELREKLVSDPNGYFDLLRISANAYEHYLNILSLLVGGMERLYCVAEETNIDLEDRELEELMRQVGEIISKSSDKPN